MQRLRRGVARICAQTPSTNTYAHTSRMYFYICINIAQKHLHINAIQCICTFTLENLKSYEALAKRLTRLGGDVNAGLGVGFQLNASCQQSLSFGVHFAKLPRGSWVPQRQMATALRHGLFRWCPSCNV